MKTGVHFNNVIGAEWAVPEPVKDKVVKHKCYPRGAPKPGSIQLLQTLLAEKDSSVHILHNDFNHPESLRLFFVKRYLQRCGLTAEQVVKLRFQCHVGEFERYIMEPVELPPGDALPFLEGAPDTEHSEDPPDEVE